MISNILGWCLFGLIAGGIARLLTPGTNPLGCLGTMALGVAGSFAGGFLGQLLFGSSRSEFHPSGLIGSVIGAILILILVRPRRTM